MKLSCACPWGAQTCALPFLDVNIFLITSKVEDNRDILQMYLHTKNEVAKIHQMIKFHRFLSSSLRVHHTRTDRRRQKQYQLAAYSWRAKKLIDRLKGNCRSTDLRKTVCVLTKFRRVGDRLIERLYYIV